MDISVSIENIRKINKEMEDFSLRGKYFEYLERHFEEKVPLLVEIIKEVQSQINYRRFQPSLATFYFFLYILRVIEKSINQDFRINETIALQTVKEILDKMFQDFKSIETDLRNFLMKNSTLGYILMRFLDRECQTKEDRTQVLITGFLLFEIIEGQMKNGGIV